MKTQVYFISILLFILVVMIFALQNASSVTLKLWFWDFNSSLSLIILASMILGALITTLIGFPSKNKKNHQLKSYQEELEILKESVKILEKQEVSSRKKLLRKEKKNDSSEKDSDTEKNEEKVEKKSK